jgi:peptidoglycan hydrolase-like protein with peptidoglycan-binding domain
MSHKISPAQVRQIRTDFQKAEGGKNDAATRKLQKDLNAVGAHLAVDGDIGPLTRDAYKAFQAKYHGDSFQSGTTPSRRPGQPPTGQPGTTPSGQTTQAAGEQQGHTVQSHAKTKPTKPTKSAKPKDKETAWIDQAFKDLGKTPSPKLLTAIKYIISVEDRQLDPKARNPSGATGLMQMMPGTFKAYMVKGHGDPTNPVDNLLAALNYMKESPSYGKGNFDAGVEAAYNHEKADHWY